MRDPKSMFMPTLISKTKAIKSAWKKIVILFTFFPAVQKQFLYERAQQQQQQQQQHQQQQQQHQQQQQQQQQHLYQHHQQLFYFFFFIFVEMRHTNSPVT